MINNSVAWPRLPVCFIIDNSTDMNGQINQKRAIDVLNKKFKKFIENLKQMELKFIIEFSMILCGCSPEKNIEIFDFLSIHKLNFCHDIIASGSSQLSNALFEVIKSIDKFTLSCRQRMIPCYSSACIFVISSTISFYEPLLSTAINNLMNKCLNNDELTINVYAIGLGKNVDKNILKRLVVTETEYLKDEFFKINDDNEIETAFNIMKHIIIAMSEKSDSPIIFKEFK